MLGKKLRFESLDGRLLLHGESLAGDYNADGSVDAADSTVWADERGMVGEHLAADGNHDGRVDALDHDVWRANFGKHSAPTDRITLHDGGFIPLQAGSSTSALIVPVGETVTLAADSEYDYIEVHGTLRVSRNYDTTLRFVDLIVFAGGELDMGTEVDPVLRKVEFIVKDVPIDTQIDPYQLGHGVINLGKWHAYGRKLDQTWTTISGDIYAGDTKIALSIAPVGWQVGDELLIPDTAQMAGSVRREATVRITAIDGNRVTLSKPLDFDHLAVRDPSGNVRLMPYAANATRNIVIRSENPSGTRGHTIQLEQSEADVRYVSFLGLGRTLAKPLDSAKVVNGVVTPGTNQVARYAWHWHHVHPDHALPGEHPHGGHLVGSFFDGTDIGKWGIVIHGTSDMHVANNVTDRFVGAGVITEDGNELRNVIERNLAMGALSTAGVSLSAKFAFIQGIPGGEGAGFWFHSSENYVRDNVAINNNMGYVVLNMFHPTGIVHGSVPLDFSRNVGLSNRFHGLEEWNSPLAFVVRDSVLANNGDSQLLFGNGEFGSITLRNTLILAQGGVSVGVHSDQAYARNLEIYDSEILGCAVGTMTVGDQYLIKGTTLQNRINFDWRLAAQTEITMISLEDVISVGLPGLSFQHFATGQVNPVYFSYPNNVGYRVLLKNWQQSGKNYVFYRPHALPSNPVIETAILEQGLTNIEAWTKYGIATDGGPVPVTAVPLGNSDGYISEFVGETPQVDFPLSRWIFLGVSAQPGFTTFVLEYTGAPADFNTQLEIDGQLLTFSLPPESSPRYFGKISDGVWNAPGEHTVRTWRTLNGEIIDGSEMVFKYMIELS